MSQLTLTSRAVAVTAALLTLQQVHQALKEREVQIAYTSLSELISTGDIAQQLRVTKGHRGRLEFLPETVEVLTHFLPLYRGTKGITREAAPALLKSFLRQAGADPAGGEEVAPSTVHVSSFHQMPNPIVLAREQGRAQGLAMTDAVLTAKQAAEFVQVPTRSIRKLVAPSFRLGGSASGDRWYRSALLSL